MHKMAAASKQGVGVGNDGDVERVRAAGSAKEEPAADHDREHVGETLGTALDGRRFAW